MVHSSIDESRYEQCMRKCHLSTIPCVDICERTKKVYERTRGKPFYVPFHQEPLRDLSTSYFQTPCLHSWRAGIPTEEQFMEWPKNYLTWQEIITDKEEQHVPFPNSIYNNAHERDSPDWRIQPGYYRNKFITLNGQPVLFPSYY